MKILAIGAHPDDIEIFMYGFIKECSNRGDNITLCIATDGSMGGNNPGLELAKKRAEETSLALKDISEPTFLGFKDGQLYNDKNSRMKINKLILDINPDLIITHYYKDYHPDHRNLSNLVIDSAGFKYPILFCETLMGIKFEPDYYIDVSKHMDSKEKAILAHITQNPQKFIKAVKIMNRYRAAQCNGPDGSFAETYKFNKSFPFIDISNLLPASMPLRNFYNENSDGLI